MNLFLPSALLLTFAALAPLLAGARNARALRARRGAAIALHRSQLRELERDRAFDLVDAADHASARLEIERRLLAADRLGDALEARPSRRLWPFVLPIPLLAAALYLVGGHPGFAPQPLAPRLVAERAQSRDADALMAKLRAAIALAPPGSEQARQGDLLLGQVAASVGDWHAAEAALAAGLAIRFDPSLAYEVAEAGTRARDDTVGPDQAALFRAALAAAPPDVEWRLDAEARIAQGERHH